MRAWYCDTYDVPLPAGHRFPMEKYRLLRERLLALGVLKPAQLTLSPLIDRATLLNAHAPAWVDAVLACTLDADEERRIGLPVGPALRDRSLASVGGTLAACREALESGFAGSLAGGTHHGLEDAGMGFCVFNDVAVALLTLLAERRFERAAVIDLDVHQGNGNAALLGRHPEFHLLDLYGALNFPTEKVRATRDVPLPDGTGDAAYLEALERLLPEVVAFRPELVVYLAGVDPLEADRIGRLSLSAEGLARRDRLVLERMKAHRIPTALVLGGGYAEPISLSIEAHVATWRIAVELFGPPG